jgi:DNA repair photolyase
MAPIVPGFSSSRSKLERTVKAIADHGARFVGCNVMYLQDGTRDHFMRFLEREFPALRPRMEKLYRKKSPPEAYRKEVKAMVRVLQQRYGMARREDASPMGGPAKDDPIEEAQVGFAW